MISLKNLLENEVFLLSSLENALGKDDSSVNKVKLSVIGEKDNEDLANLEKLRKRLGSENRCTVHQFEFEVVEDLSDSYNTDIIAFGYPKKYELIFTREI